PTAFEVGDDVRAAFVTGDAQAAAHFSGLAGKPGKWLADLPALALMRLRRAGVEDVHASGLCTVSDPRRFFSYRRDGATGRMALHVWRQEALSQCECKACHMGPLSLYTRIDSLYAAMQHRVVARSQRRVRRATQARARL